MVLGKLEPLSGARRTEKHTETFSWLLYYEVGTIIGFDGCLVELSLTSILYKIKC